jgi:hypothetical protein
MFFTPSLADGTLRMLVANLFLQVKFRVQYSRMKHRSKIMSPIVSNKNIENRREISGGVPVRMKSWPSSEIICELENSIYKNLRDFFWMFECSDVGFRVILFSRHIS